MIRVLNNYPLSSSTPKITVTCKGVKKNGNSYSFFNAVDPSSDFNYYELNSNRFLFVKFVFNGLSSSNDIAKTMLALAAASVPCTMTLKVLSVSSSASLSDSAQNLYNAIDFSNSGLIEQVVLQSTSAYSSSTTQTNVNIDLSKVTSLLNSSDSELIIAITCDAPETYELRLYDPHQIAEYVSNPEIVSVLSSFEGLNSLNKFFECSCSSFDNGYVNLVNGRAIHLFDCLKTSNKKLPISLSIAHNSNTSSNGLCLPNHLRLSFEYVISKSNNIYYLTDFTNKKRAYFHITRPNDSLDYDDLGIKHLDNEGELYYCYEDCSYMYVDNDSTVELWHLQE